MKTLKIQMDEEVLEKLEKFAKRFGMKPQEYAKLVLGQHVQGMEATDLGRKAE